MATPSGSLPDYRITGGALALAWEGRDDAGTRFIDVNGDGLVDVLFSYKNSNGSVSNYLLINTGTGWTDGSPWALPSGAWIAQGGSNDSGRRLIDINGDGLPDLVWNMDNSEKGCLINNIDGRFQPGGPAWVSNSAWAPPLPISSNVSSGSDFFDVNGDGLPDQIQHGISNGIEAGVALNSGTGWVAWNRVNVGGGTPFATYRAALGAVGKYLPPALLRKDGTGYRSTPIGAEIVDLNGDGLPDIIMSNPKLSAAQGGRQAWLNTGDGWVASAEYAPPAGVNLLGRTNGNRHRSHRGRAGGPQRRRAAGHRGPSLRPDAAALLLPQHRPRLGRLQHFVS